MRDGPLGRGNDARGDTDDSLTSPHAPGEGGGGTSLSGPVGPTDDAGVRRSLRLPGGLALRAVTVACPKRQPPFDTNNRVGNSGTLSERRLHTHRASQIRPRRWPHPPGPSRAHTPGGGPHKDADPSPHVKDGTQDLEGPGGCGA